MAYSESPFSSSSSSYRHRWKYDVFLSFREDTRKQFTDHLYHALIQAGIHTFRGDNELSRGEEISPQLLRTIEGSRISVVVFSRNYAFSRWCLDELVKIIECRQKIGQVVLPIFYDMNPSDVRKQTGSYAEAFDEHEKKFKEEMEKVNRWREALTQAANLSGWGVHNETNGYEAELIKTIVNDVASKLGKKTRIEMTRPKSGWTDAISASEQEQNNVDMAQQREPLFTGEFERANDLNGGGIELPRDTPDELKKLKGSKSRDMVDFLKSTQNDAAHAKLGKSTSSKVDFLLQVNRSIDAGQSNMVTLSKKKATSTKLRARQKTFIEDCHQNYGRIVSDLKEVLAGVNADTTMKPQDARDVHAKISSCLAIDNSCRDGFSHSRKNKRFRAALLSALSDVKGSCEKALGLIPRDTPNELKKLKGSKSRDMVDFLKSGWTLLMTNLILETASAVFDQLGHALVGMVLAFVALLLATAELIHMARKERIIQLRCVFYLSFSYYVL